MTNDERKLAEELRYWLEWTAAQRPGNETQVLYVPQELGAIIVNLN